MQAVILAGGLGTRLRSVVNDRPKPMALVNGKPFLEYVLKELQRNDISDIIFAIGYKGSLVEEYFGNGFDLGINIQYSYEDGQLGTAGAIKNATNLIKGDGFYVLNGDTYYRINYKKLKELNIKHNSIMSLVLRNVENVSRYGEAILDKERLIGFNEKTTKEITGTINGGIYYMTKKIFDYIPEGKVSLENDVIPVLLENDCYISAIVNDGYFIDIGIPEDYFKFQEDIKNLIILR